MVCVFRDIPLILNVYYLFSIIEINDTFTGKPIFFIQVINNVCFFFQVMDIYPHELSIPFDETMCEEIPNTILMVDDNSQNTSDGESIDIEIDV